MSFGLAISSIAKRIKDECGRVDFYLRLDAFATVDSMTIADLDAAKEQLASCMNEIDKRRARLLANVPKDMVA